MKSLVLAPFDNDALNAMNGLTEVVHESWTETRLLYSPDELAQRANEEGIDILVIEADFAFEELFEGAPGLLFVGVCRQELNHVDIGAATRHGVVVVNTPARNARAVAEHTIGLMLSLARRIPEAHSYVKSKMWHDPVGPYITMRGTELGGKVLGIIGLGAIGRIVARLARGMGMKVLAYDPYAGAIGQRVRGVPLASLEDLLHESHFVTLHVPRASETNGLLDSNRIQMMREGAFLVNTSSYAAVDEHALVEALRSGRLSGAALDVHEAHPIPTTSPLLGLDNVVLTPHIGGATKETISRYSWMIVDAVRAFLKGRRPQHLVNPEVWRVRRGR